MVQHGPAFQLRLLSQYPATGSREGPCETESRTRMICEVTQCNSQFLDKKCASKHGFTFKYPKFASPKIRLAAFCRCSAAAAATWGRMGWSQCQILMLRVSLKTYLFTKDLPRTYLISWVDYTWPAMHHAYSCFILVFDQYVNMKVSASSASSCFAWAALSLSKAWPIHYGIAEGSVAQAQLLRNLRETG